MDTFFKAELFDLHPPEVTVLTPVSSQPIHLVYLAKVAQHDSAVGEIGESFTLSVKICFLIAILLVMAYQALDSFLLAKSRRNRSARRTNQIFAHLLRIGGIIFDQPLPSLVGLSSVYPFCNLLFALMFWICCRTIANSVKSELVLVDVIIAYLYLPIQVFDYFISTSTVERRSKC